MVQNGLNKEILSRMSVISIPLLLICAVVITKFLRNTLKLRTFTFLIIFKIY